MERTVAEPRPTGLDGGNGWNGWNGGGGLATRHTEPRGRGGAGSGRGKILRLYRPAVGGAGCLMNVKSLRGCWCGMGGMLLIVLNLSM